MVEIGVNPAVDYPQIPFAAVTQSMTHNGVDVIELT